MHQVIMVIAERCQMITWQKQEETHLQHLHSIDTEMRLTMQEVKNNSNDHFDSHAKTKSSSTHGIKHSKIHHRKKLKALVMDGNRICYEKITE